MLSPLSYPEHDIKVRLLRVTGLPRNEKARGLVMSAPRYAVTESRVATTGAHTCPTGTGDYSIP